MNKLLSGIAIGISLAVIVFQLLNFIELSDKEQYEKSSNTTTVERQNIELCFDTNGFPAGSDENGFAMDISSKGGFQFISARVKDGQFVKCMTKDEATNYLISLGSDNSEIKTILNQYPEFTKLD